MSDHFFRKPLCGFLLICLLWAVFYTGYEYRMLMDDGHYMNILQGLASSQLSPWTRFLHEKLFYLQGLAFGASAEKSFFLAVLLHLAAVWTAWKHVATALPQKSRIPALIGVGIFAVHPVSMQTVVHIAQRSEILGVLFAAFAVSVYLKSLQAAVPSWKHALWSGLLALLALESKESYFTVCFLMFFAIALRMRSRAVFAAVLATLVIGAVVATRDTVLEQNSYEKTIYKRSRIARDAAIAGKTVDKEDSVVLTFPGRLENLQIQTALVPRRLQITFAPFGTLFEYGRFPFGLQSYSLQNPWLWSGTGLMACFVLLVLVFRRRFSFHEWLLVLSPALHYSVFWLFPVYDTLFLYRMYGSIFFMFVLSVPLVVGRLTDVRKKAPQIIMPVLGVLCLAAALTRYAEMRTHVSQTGVEMYRVPENYRVYYRRLHALVDGGLPVDCARSLEPARTLSPSLSVYYIELAWCLMRQGEVERARYFARQSLEHESFGDNIHLALSYISVPEGALINKEDVHPLNRGFILPAFGKTPSGDELKKAAPRRQ
ncbi:MAG: hypothetical protein A2583_00865 [Bdellovibrionales bacterium RIFOXYD1_FULL_53_11]|nr:MAG: hypothetical protein A2583_00865 [Bdellovibrionales bacterium RIFOXYD1_FULL_53_11]